MEAESPSIQSPALTRPSSSRGSDTRRDFCSVTRISVLLSLGAAVALVVNLLESGISLRGTDMGMDLWRTDGNASNTSKAASNISSIRTSKKTTTTSPSSAMDPVVPEAQKQQEILQLTTRYAQLRDRGQRAQKQLSQTLREAQEVQSELHGVQARLSKLDVAMESEHKAACGSKPYYDLVIVIPAHAQNDIHRRNILRQSWLNYLDKNGSCKSCRTKRTAKVLFVLGEEGTETTRRNVSEEKAKFGDIHVLQGYSQTYYESRARKTRLSIKAALELFCFALLLKTDTDSYVFLHRFYTWAESQKMFLDVLPEKQYSKYAGNFIGTGAKPVTKAGNKWQDLVYSKSTGLLNYGRHAKGAGYAMTPDLCRFIADLDLPSEVSERRITFPGMRPPVLDLPSEDVSVGFWLTALNFTKVDMPVALAATGCKEKEKVIDHYVPEIYILARWAAFLQYNDPCHKLATASNATDVELDSEQPAKKVWVKDANRGEINVHRRRRTQQRKTVR